MNARRRRWLGLLATIPCSAWAATFSVNPIRLEMAASQRATSVTIENYSPDPLWLQVRVYRWERKDGEDLLSEVEGDDQPIVTPPVFRLAPTGGSQLVRIGFPAAAIKAGEEREWRVVVEELPTMQDSSTEAITNLERPVAPTAIALRVRVSIPLLQRPSQVHQELLWTLDPLPLGHARLTARNVGSVTERLDEIQVAWADEHHWRAQGPLYLFPGESRSFDVDAGSEIPPGPVQLSLLGTPRTLKSELVLSAQ